MHLIVRWKVYYLEKKTIMTNKTLKGSEMLQGTLVGNNYFQLGLFAKELDN